MSKKILYVILFLVVCLSVVHGQTVPPYQSQLEAVERKLRSGDFQGALSDLDRVSNEYPNDPDLFYAKALIYGQAGDYAGAIESAKFAYEKKANIQNLQLLLDLYKRVEQHGQVIALLRDFRSKSPALTMASHELMRELARQGDYGGAYFVYDEEVKEGRHSDTLDVVKADLLLQQGNIDESIIMLKNWDGKSSLRQVYSALGYMYITQKKVKLAVETLTRGVKISSDPLLYLDLGGAYLEDGKAKLAYESFYKGVVSNKIDFADKYRIMMSLMSNSTKSLSLDQMQELANELVLKHARIPESHIIKGNILWDKGSRQESRSLYMTAVGINPNHIDAWRLLINADLFLGHVDEAIAHGKEALVANPRNATIMYFAGLAYLVKDDYEDSRKMFELALDHSENDNKYLQAMIYGALGDVYNQLKMHDASDVAYEEAILLDSVNVAVLNNYAYYLSLRKKNLDRAEELSRLSNELQPNSDTYQDTYAWILFQKEKYSDALIWIEKAMKGANPSAVLHEHYGDILIKMGREKDAIKQWEKAILLNKKGEVDVDKVNLKIREKRYVE